MIVGFTGTRKGLTDKQRDSLTSLITKIIKPNEVHHGMCIGADEEFHKIIVDYEAGSGVIVNIEGHPPTNKQYTMKYNEDEFFKIHFPRPYLDRNKDIVKQSQLLIVGPEGPEVVRSGTWSTVRYLKSHNWVQDHYIVWPSGIIEKNGRTLVGLMEKSDRYKII